MRICSALIALALAGVAGAASARGMRAPTDPVAQFAIGTAAMARSDLGEATRRYDAALAADPSNVTLRRAAFGMALMTGDRHRVDALAAQLSPGEGQDSVLLLLRLVQAFERRDWRAASAVADSVQTQKLFGEALPAAIRAWAKFDGGDRAGALTMLKPEGAAPGAFSAIAEQRARMLVAAGRYAEARTAFAGLLLGGERGVDLRIAAADAAARMGYRAAAHDLLVETEPSGALERARTRLEAGHAIQDEGNPARAGLAALMGALIGELGQRQPVAAIPFARIAAFMAPRRGVETLRLADMLNRASQYEAALATAASVPEGSLWAGEATGLRAQVLMRREDQTAALALLRRAAEGKRGGAFEWSQLGGAEMQAKAFAPAAQSYTRAIELAQAKGPVAWPLWFQRGSAYEQAKDWPHAEADLRRALALSPREPIVLNYLGYSLIDRGLKMDEGTKLVQQALAGAPNDPAILDSLGWAYYHGARYADAVGPLERAVAGAPGDAAVIEHLGDAYWKVGRRLEARFQWNAAATLDPDTDEKARLAAKIDYGLDRAVLAGAMPAA